MSGAGQFCAFKDVAILDAVRTPWVDVGGALAQVSPIDLGIKVGREVLARSGLEAQAVDTVLAGSMAQASFDAYMLPRHIGLYSGVPQQVPALAVQRICATGFELLRQAGYHVMLFSLPKQLKDGERFPLTLHFEHAGAVQVEVAVQKDAPAAHGGTAPGPRPSLPRARCW